MLVMFGMTAGNSLSIDRIIAKRIGKLQEGTRIIGEGNLDYRIAHEGTDELTELTLSFNDATEKLKRHRVQLEAANQELDSFAYAVAHDLRAPLRAMSGFSQALLEDYGGELKDDARVYLDHIIMASKRMGDLVEGLLILSRSTRGELKYSVIDLSAQASQILNDLAMGDTARKVEWRVQPGLTALGDIRMIEVVLRNLLENAWKFTSHTVAPLIRLFAEPKGEEHFFCIADNGVGFDMRHAEHLFKPFQRLHRQDEFPGTGIGLATVQRILHRHNGTIHAIAAPGKGATFYFSLPLQG
jgi:signal transduction histidine kinase